MSRRLLTLLIPILLVAVSLIVIALGRGYRLNIKEKEIKPSGILVATSEPNGAQVFVNKKFTTATNSTLNLEPGWYEVRLHKEGYQDWSKKMRLQGEVVVKTDAVLFPNNPSLSPLTTTGAANPILSPDGTKIAFSATPSAQPRALRLEPRTYILDLTSRPLPFNKNPQVYEGTLDQLLTQWQLEATSLARSTLLRLPKEFVKIATTSAQILALSPDESKVLYQATASAALAKVIDPPLIGANPTEENRGLEPNKTYVYDVKEDRNYQVPSSKFQVPGLQWLSTSRHLILVEKEKISILEYDSNNKVTVYSGPFENSFVFPHPTRRSLIILTSLNPEASSLPNLYSLSLE